MRFFFFFVFFFVAIAPASAFDKQAHKFGLGVELGDPTGLTGKYYLDRNLALQGGFGLWAWPFGPGGHLDLLYEIPNAVKTPKEPFELPLYIGGGIKAGNFYHCSPRRRFTNGCYYDPFFGVRVPVGVALQLRKTPLEFQLEAAPVFYGGFFWFWWGIGVEADIALSARYYF